ncbi:g66 [Coccomyxa viridis]|uniref:G66 protein n=1 Tax=Coccomyxa viridis TaxID=1274662 RepID=A0ABP1FEU7_9CHLO
MWSCSAVSASSGARQPCCVFNLPSRVALRPHLSRPLKSLSSRHERSSVPFSGRSAARVCRASANGAGAEYVEPDGFRIEKISFGAILTPLGVFLLTYGFGSFFQLLPGADIAAILLIYGFPITLLGFALSYAQLKPVPCKTTKEALALRDSQATDIQKQLREDVTRFRYGDEQHLDEALTRIFQFGRQKGIPRRFTPILRGVREEASEGAYTLVLEFETKKDMTMDMWTDRVDKIESFFGPGITAKVNEAFEGVDVELKADGSGSGRGGEGQKDVLPPLMPGMKARQQARSS